MGTVHMCDTTRQKRGAFVVGTRWVLSDKKVPPPHLLLTKWVLIHKKVPCLPLILTSAIRPMYISTNIESLRMGKVHVCDTTCQKGGLCVRFFSKKWIKTGSKQ